jgi:hypothetical protein
MVYQPLLKIIFLVVSGFSFRSEKRRERRQTLKDRGRSRLYSKETRILRVRIQKHMHDAGRPKS